MSAESENHKIPWWFLRLTFGGAVAVLSNAAVVGRWAVGLAARHEAKDETIHATRHEGKQETKRETMHDTNSETKHEIKPTIL